MVSGLVMRNISSGLLSRTLVIGILSSKRSKIVGGNSSSAKLNIPKIKSKKG